MEGSGKCIAEMCVLVIIGTRLDLKQAPNTRASPEIQILPNQIREEPEAGGDLFWRRYH